jgi:hypothetical protein
MNWMLFHRRFEDDSGEHLTAYIRFIPAAGWGGVRRLAGLLAGRPTANGGRWRKNVGAVAEEVGYRFAGLDLRNIGDGFRIG